MQYCRAYIAVKPVTTLNKTLVGKEGAPSQERLLKLSHKEDQYRLMKRVIHVNQHVIKRNKKTGEREAPLTAKSYKDNTKASEIRVDGPCRIVYRPDAPLPCGAHVWIETKSDIEILR